MSKDLLEVLHETAKGFQKAGAMSEQTMKEFDVLCLPHVKKYTPKDIMKIRKSNKVSQSVFAAYLNITPSTVQKWEQGQKKPSSLGLKLLSLVERHGLSGVI